MKKIYLLMCPALFWLGSCSMDDVLDGNDDLNLSVVETNNPIKVEPGETVFFRFVASTSKGEVSRVEISSEDGIKPIVEKTLFAMIDETLALSMDKNGYFSRPVSTVLVMYPVEIPNEQALRGKTLNLNLKVTRDDGKTKVLRQEFEIIRYINNRYGFDMTGKNMAWVYNPTDDVVYSMSDYKNHLSSIDLILYVDGSSKYYCLNPAAAETETIMKGLGYTDYQAAEMNSTKLMGGVTLNFALITEKELADLDVVNGVDKLLMGNNVACGFVTKDGRNGFAKHLYKSPNRLFVSKMQINAN